MERFQQPSAAESSAMLAGMRDKIVHANQAMVASYHASSPHPNIIERIRASPNACYSPCNRYVQMAVALARVTEAKTKNLTNFWITTEMARKAFLPARLNPICWRL